MVHLEELNKYNVWDVLDLTVKKEQERFLASNEWSLVHAYVGNKTEGAVYPFGIFADDKAVGFLMIAYDYGEVCNDPDAPEIARNNYFLWRLMIDEEEQGKGYGRKAVELALEFVKTFPTAKRITAGFAMTRTTRSQGSYIFPWDLWRSANRMMISTR